MATSPMVLNAQYGTVNSNEINGAITALSYDPTWAAWNQQTYTNSIQTGQMGQLNVWIGWNTQYTTGNFYAHNGLSSNDQGVMGQAVPVPEQLAAQIKANDEEQKKAADAKKRAREALLLTLNDTQRKTFEKDNTFELMVNDRIYRVRPGARVERLNKTTRKVESYFCIHPELHHRLPAEDVALSQKFMLEAAEAEFLRIANETRAA